MMKGALWKLVENCFGVLQGAVGARHKPSEPPRRLSAEVYTYRYTPRRTDAPSPSRTAAAAAALVPDPPRTGRTRSARPRSDAGSARTYGRAYAFVAGHALSQP